MKKMSALFFVKKNDKFRKCHEKFASRKSLKNHMGSRKIEFLHLKIFDVFRNVTYFLENLNCAWI